MVEFKYTDEYREDIPDIGTSFPSEVVFKTKGVDFNSILFAFLKFCEGMTFDTKIFFKKAQEMIEMGYTEEDFMEYFFN